MTNVKLVNFRFFKFFFLTKIFFKQSGNFLKKLKFRKIDDL